MHFRQIINTIGTVLSTTERLGVTAPKAVLDEYANLCDLADKVRRLDKHADVAGAVLNALEHDRDPHDDEAVRSALTSLTVTQMTNGVEDLLGLRAMNLVVEHADEILGSFTTPFEDAATKINTGLTRLGDVDLTNAHEVLNRGGDAALVWANLQYGSEVINSIRAAWKLLSGAGARLNVQPRYQPLIIADIDPDEYAEQQFTTWVPPIALAQRGFTLSFATPSILKTRIEAAQAAQTHAANAYGRAFERKYAATGGMN